MAQHVALGELMAVSADDERLDRLAQHFIRHANDGRLHHSRELVQHVLDLFGSDLLAAALDNVILAGDEVQKALLVHLE